MKVPYKVRIKYRVTYQIAWVDRFGDETCRGLCDSEARTITILKGMSNLLTWKTFIHELLHAVELEHKLPFPHKLIYLLEAPIVKILQLNDLI